jgi:SOS-response transcriptional repressor LexA
MAISNPMRRNKIVSFVDSYTKENGYCPTVREIGYAVGLKSTSTVYGHLKRMQRDGILTFSPFTPRSITLNETHNRQARRKSVMKNCNMLLHCSFQLPGDGCLVSVVAIMVNEEGQALPPIRAASIEEECV